jgi:hypothetical protein
VCVCVCVYISVCGQLLNQHFFSFWWINTGSSKLQASKLEWSCRQFNYDFLLPLLRFSKLRSSGFVLLIYDAAWMGYPFPTFWSILVASSSKVEMLKQNRFPKCREVSWTSLNARPLCWLETITQLPCIISQSNRASLFKTFSCPDWLLSTTHY